MANEEVKLILFDDGSTDDTWEYILRITADDPNTKGFQSKHRTGHTILYDNGFSIANTDYIGVLHADMIVPPNFFDVLLPYLNENDVVSAKCIEPPLHPPGAEKIVKSFGMYPDEFNRKEFVKFVEQESKDKAGQTLPSLFAPWFINKKKYMELIGGHDRQFAPYGWEDADLFVRMVRAGFNPVQVQSLLVYHFTQRGHRWNGGDVGKAHDDYQLQMYLTRNRFATKWGTLDWKNELHTPTNIPLYYKQLTIKNYSESLDARAKYEVLQFFFNRVMADGQVLKTDGQDFSPNYEIVLDYNINYLDMTSLMQLIQQIPFVVEQYEVGTYEVESLLINIFNTQQL
jgi:glycosyltransferase involved in cell wall biosynthesis